MHTAGLLRHQDWAFDGRDERKFAVTLELKSALPQHHGWGLAARDPGVRCFWKMGFGKRPSGFLKGEQISQGLGVLPSCA